MSDPAAVVTAHPTPMHPPSSQVLGAIPRARPRTRCISLSAECYKEAKGKSVPVRLRRVAAREMRCGTSPAWRLWKRWGEWKECPLLTLQAHSVSGSLCGSGTPPGSLRFTIVPDCRHHPVLPLWLKSVSSVKEHIPLRWLAARRGRGIHAVPAREECASDDRLRTQVCRSVRALAWQPTSQPLSNNTSLLLHDSRYFFSVRIRPMPAKFAWQPS